jgi:hypothetical protein
MANKLFKMNVLRGASPIYRDTYSAILWRGLPEAFETAWVKMGLTVLQAKSAFFLISPDGKTVSEDSRSVIRFLDAQKWGYMPFFSLPTGRKPCM